MPELFEIYNQEMENKETRLSLQEGVLARGMLQRVNNTTVDYRMDSNGVKAIKPLDDRYIDQLVEEYKKVPKDCLALARNNLIAISKDKRLDKVEKKERVDRYLDAYFELQIKLDHKAFPYLKDLNKVLKGIPEYIPDGMTDMGSDYDLNPIVRGREKIRINKKEIFKQSKELFEKIFNSDLANYDSHDTESVEKFKKYVVSEVADFVYNKMPYNKEFKDIPFQRIRSIRLDEVFNNNLSVCRHHALYTQVLLQSFGITSRLLKCDVDFGRARGGGHAANLVRINNKWYLLDSTIPDPGTNQKKYGIFIKKIDDKRIDLNYKNYEWSLKEKNGENRIYKSRNEMYYRINKN